MTDALLEIDPPHGKGQGAGGATLNVMLPEFGQLPLKPVFNLSLKLIVYEPFVAGAVKVLTPLMPLPLCSVVPGLKTVNTP